jgi:ATP-dependent Clp protease, protease subunit
MRRNLINLLRANKQKGSFKAEGNTIFLYDFIVSSEDEAYWYGGVSAEAFAKALAEMTGPVTVRLNSPGGDVFGGRAMAAAIRGYDNEVTVQIDGYAASAASTVAIAGDRVIASPDAMVMIHRAWTITMGNEEDHMSTATLLQKIDATIVDGYIAKAGGERSDWQDLLNAETWFTASEAAEKGLIDEVLPTRLDKSENRIKWDLSAYHQAPEKEEDEVVPPIADKINSSAEEIAARQRMLTVDLL